MINKQNEICELLPACSGMKLTSKTGRPYWFRTLDFKSNIWENGAHLVSFPKGQSITLTNMREKIVSSYEIMGMTYNKKDECLIDGINDNGLFRSLQN